MAHYAIVNENDIVTKVITGVNEDDTSNLPEGFATWEEWYKDYLSAYKVIRCSYNTKGGVHYVITTESIEASDDQSKAFRGNFPGVGWLYNEDNDIFHEPQPYASWTLNTTTGFWESPIAKPDDGNRYDWNESAYQADNSQGWELYE